LLLLTAVSACRTGASTPDPIAAVPTISAPTATAVSPIAADLPTAEISTTAPEASTAAYPAMPTLEPTAYPAPATAVPAASPTTDAYPAPGGNQETYLPVIGKGEQATSTAQPPTAAPSPTSVPTVDFAAVKADLQAQGQDLAYAKIGFHVSVGGNTEGLDEWMRQLDAAGVPFFLKSADNAEPIYVAQELMRQSGVPHTLVYRKVAGGNHVSVPNYDLPPEEAARQHWQLHTEAFPPELDPSLVWMETMNEVDKNRSEWLAQFALTTAQLALQDGRKWAAFGWSSGEPEPEDWESPAMLEFLRLAGEHPEQLAIAVHEYSYDVNDIGDGYPYKIGRFLEIFRVADKYGIPRPTILITEWGWTYEEVPEPAQALIDIDWAARLYAPYPQVKGAAIWYLGPTHTNLADLTQRLIQPVLNYSLTHYFAVPQPPDKAALDPKQFPPP